ncbi:MAG: DUF1616 domain-containing protein [Candidatus Thorarchaeota archaeon]
MAEKKEKRKQRFKERLVDNAERNEIKANIGEALTIRHPTTVRALVTILQNDYEKPKNIVLKIIHEMEQNNELFLQEPIPEPTIPPQRIRDYFFGRNYFSYEFWLVISSIILTFTLVAINVTSGFFFYLRYVIIVFYLLILPGWTLTAAIFPELNDKLRFLERVATAIGLSIVILVLIGIFLNYTFRFTPMSITAVLAVFSIICQGIAIGLRYRLAKIGYIFKPKINDQEIEIIEG